MRTTYSAQCNEHRIRRNNGNMLVLGVAVAAPVARCTSLGVTRRKNLTDRTAFRMLRGHGSPGRCKLLAW